MSSVGKDLFKGLVAENPVFGLVLGLCPTLAVTTTLSGGFWMGLAVVFVLTLSNALISALRRFIPDHIRIPAFILVIATFVTVADQVLHAFLPTVYRVLGVFVPLIVVNCIILGRAEAFASKSPVGRSLADGLGMGLGFLFALLSISVVREVLGSGNLALGGLRLLGQGRAFAPAVIMALPPGAFFAIGTLLALFRWARGPERAGRRQSERPGPGRPRGGGGSRGACGERAGGRPPGSGVAGPVPGCGVCDGACAAPEEENGL